VVLSATSDHPKHALATKRALFNYKHLSGPSHRMRCCHRLQTTVNTAVPVRHKHCTHGGAEMLGGVPSDSDVGMYSRPAESDVGMDTFDAFLSTIFAQPRWMVQAAGRLV
jgi:hypothetical protein